MVITRENQSCSEMRVVEKRLIKEQNASKVLNMLKAVFHPMVEKNADACRIELIKVINGNK